MSNELLTRAAHRAQQKSLPYAGEVTPAEAHELAQSGARLIDVRSRFEHEYIGRPPNATLIEWKSWTTGELNPRFLDELKEHCRHDDVVLLLCRSGVRSHAAGVAAADAGFIRAYNILEGFEGDLDDNRQRGNLGGWRKAGLPWIQN